MTDETPDCKHEAPPYPSSNVVRDPFLLGAGPSRIAYCIHCGIPVRRMRDTRVLMSKDWLERHTGQTYDGPCYEDEL